MSNPQPAQLLEMRAAEQRRHLHGTVEELRESIKHRLDVKENARRYLAPASGVLAVLGLVVGYTIAGMFSEHTE